MGNLTNKINDTGYTTPYMAGLDILGDNVEAIDKFIKSVLLLPRSIQKIMQSFSAAEFIEDKLGAVFNLSAEQKYQIAVVVKDILFSKTFLGDMPKEIQAKLGVSPDVAAKVAAMIVSDLFGPAIEEIKKAQSTAFSDRLAGKSAETPR